MLLVALALVAGAVWAVYGRSLDAPFIFDDKESVVNNASIRRLWPLLGIAEQPGPLRPPHHIPMSGRPLVNLTLALNYHFGGLEPFGYHVVNISLHLLVALLLFAIIRRTLQLAHFGNKFDRAATPLALAVVLLWAVHPLVTETVIYTTQRTELMVAFFYLATLYSSLRYWAAPTSGGRAVWLSLAVLASLAGMASKEVMVSAPVIVLLFERTLVAGSFRRAWQQSWPLYVGLATTWCMLLALNSGGPRSGSAGFHLGVSAHAWWFTQAKVLLMYLKLAVWPWPLAIHYEMPYLDTVRTAWPWLLGVGLLAIGTGLLLWRNRTIGLMGAWMLLILAPTSLIPITTEVAAERRMYLPLSAAVAMAVVGGYWLVQRMARHFSSDARLTAIDRWLLVAAGSAAMVLVCVAGLASAHRLEAFRDALALWQDTVASQPDDPAAHCNLGAELADVDRVQEAIEHYRQALRIRPDYADAINGLGVELARMGHMEEAIEHFQRAIQLQPGDIKAHRNLGKALANAGRTHEAIGCYQRALRIRPDDADSHNNLGVALAVSSRMQEAAQQFQEAIRLRPDHIEARYNLGTALDAVGQPQEAIVHYQQALRTDPGRSDIHYNLGNALAKVGRAQEAIEHYRQAMRLNPHEADCYARLAEAHAQMKQPAEAIAAAQHAVDLARANGQTALADRIEGWLADYRASHKP